MLRRPPIIFAFGAQLLSCGLLWLIASIARGGNFSIPPYGFVATQALIAAGLAYLFSLRRWWVLVSAAFGPLLILLIEWDLPAWIYLSALIALLLLYSNSITKGVPLYLSGRFSLECIRGRILAYRQPFRFLDLGCGIGSAVIFLSRHFVGSSFVGVENAPIVYAIAKLRSIYLRNVDVRFGSIWNINWGEFDVVYCFLSPVPMPEVWRKAKLEMRPGTLLISNSFTIPGIPPHETIDMNDWRQSKIFIWKM